MVVDGDSFCELDFIMRLRLLAGLIGMGMLLGGAVRAQTASDVTISAQATPSEVRVDETVTFEIQVEGASLSDVEAMDPPQTSNLVLQSSTPAKDREVSFDSGRLTRRVTLSWRYRPVREGFGYLRPTTLRVHGEEYTTDEIRVRIVPQSQRPRRAPARSSQSPDPQGRATMDSRALFLRATASDDTAYENEQVTAEYRLFFRPEVRLRQSRMADAWDAPGFWREELDVASRPTPRSTEAYGQTYRAIVLKRVALFPTRAGTLRVEPLRIETEAQTGGPMGQRSSPYEPVTLSSEALSVTARSLPSGAPAAFDGDVGQFALDTAIEADSVQVGEDVELTVRIEGTGNISTVSPPIVEPPSEFEAYDPAVDTDVDRGGDSVRGSKTFSYTFVPRTNGQYTLPPVRFVYFDPDVEQYETLRSEPVTLHVTGDVSPQAVSRTGQGLPIGDIAGPIADDVRWVRPDRAPLHRQPWAYLVVLVPVMLGAGGVAYRYYALGETGGTGDVRQSTGLEAAQRHLHDAHHCLRSGDIRSFYQTVERAVLTFLVTRLDLSRQPSGMTREVLDRELVHHDVPDADRKALHDLLDACEEAQYAPVEPSHDSRQATLDHAQALLLRLEERFQDEAPSGAAPAGVLGTLRNYVNK